MRRFERKMGFKEVLESWPVLIILALIALFLLIVVVRFFDKMIETHKNKQVAYSKFTELERGKNKLVKDIARLKTHEGLEESIREKFGWAKDGEGLIVVVEEKREEPLPLEANSRGFFSFLRDLFK